jgi:broad specificity phosphatase PhoE
MRFVLIPCAASDWQAKGRLLGRVELSPTLESQAQLSDWGERLRAAGLQRILHSTDELATRTAKGLARLLGAPQRKQRDLDEVDLGVWAGLTEEQLENRFTSAHRQLCDSPLSVTAPDGESLAAAAGRIHDFLARWLKKDGRTTGLVLRPLVYAMARCTLEGRPLEEVWHMARQPAAPLVVNVEQIPALLAGRPPSG